MNFEFHNVEIHIFNFFSYVYDYQIMPSKLNLSHTMIFVINHIF